MSKQTGRIGQPDNNFVIVVINGRGAPSVYAASEKITGRKRHIDAVAGGHLTVPMDNETDNRDGMLELVNNGFSFSTTL